MSKKTRKKSHNNGTPRSTLQARHEFPADSIASKYEEIKKEIDQLVIDIRTNVSNSNPELLMDYLTVRNFMLMLNKSSESDFTAEEDYQLRSVEYIQSVLVGTNTQFSEIDDSEEQEKLFETILNQSVELYKKTQHFLLCWGMKAKEEGVLIEEEQEYIMLSQLMFMVRGTQYQLFRIPILRLLIEPHTEEIEKAYGVTADIVVNGLERLEKSLSSGRLDAIKRMHEQMDTMLLFTENDIPDSFKEEASQTIRQVIGIDLFDIKRITGWPDELIDDLTYNIGEDDSFYAHEDFCGWPIWNLPVQRKPCIWINGHSYTFDYSNFFDNFYRVLQKALANRIPKDESLWSSIQAKTSERIVSSIFEELLPGCTIHHRNYYPIEKCESAENDLLIEYKDVLMIVEVKAGSFTFTPALTDFAAHKDSIKSLVEKEEKQCLRTSNYISESKEVPFYNGDNLHTEVFRIRKDDYSQIYLLDVTIDSFNELASCMEKIRIADTHVNIIVISLDDLWVYKEYFDSPLQFVHYLKQRTIATQTKEIVTSDELDHLGMYIEHNTYSKHAQIVGKGYTNVFFSGYREDLDRYFSLKHEGKKVEKPKQHIPEEIRSIMDCCFAKEDPFTTHFSNFILDMYSDTRQAFCDSIHKISRRESELNSMIQAIAFGEVSFCLYVNKPGIKKVSWEEQREYVLAILAKNEKPYCYLIEICVDNQDKITEVKYDYLTQSSIPAEDRERLRDLGDCYSKRRATNYLIQNHKKKIGRNDLCPCGSGKKYKYCCGR